MGRDPASGWRRDRDHHAAAGRVKMAAISLHESSLRKQGPVAAGLCGYKKSPTPGPNAAGRAKGPPPAGGRRVERWSRASPSAVFARLARAIQYAAASRFMLKRSGILDPRFRGDDEMRVGRRLM